ncbi:mitochondrial import receptor subunit TOM22 homolog [Stegodyphus dumicola]|uniref:mitochondrial import receptor subunit TOM22 homolog n=1 Tax=Stegodyphus dumicola TaxID=202533 RepID=UPI0015AB0F56|nr:mitochondrial import receptor subunit TOM22 homolog [Stegodyphus dumicola]XP_035213253.1 mitochondrial import receptor subunit TOM22 homolog [Stegodyphus dumicola]
MPIIEEIDSGIDANSSSNSREDSPTTKKSDMAKIKDDDDDDIDETLMERLWGLTEMFPESLRNFTSSAVSKSVSGAKCIYEYSRSAVWIICSSTAILVAPVVIEFERMQLEDMQRQQQRQILLGPSAAVSAGGMPGLGMPMPPQMAQR